MTLKRATHTDMAQLRLLAETDAVERPPTVQRTKSHVNGNQRIAKVPEHIHIERLIMHQLDHWEQKWQFADALAAFDEDARKLFADHIKTVIELSEWDAYFVNDDGPVSSLCNQLLGTTEEFVESSKELAQNLYDAMTTRSISRGDFVAAIYRHDDEKLRRIAIFKLDLERRHLRDFNRIGDETHVNITQNDNILPLAKKEHVTKCALLSPSDECSANDMQIRRFTIKLLDAQAGPQSQAIAAFFFRGFLKAELLPNARRRTQEFLKTTSNWISHHELDLTTREKETFYGTRRAALSTAMNEGDLDIEKFVRDALSNRKDLHDGLMSEIERTVIPSSHISETTSMRFGISSDVARPFVRRVIYELDRGARLIVPAEDYTDLVHIEPVPGQNKQRIVIETHTFREVER